MANKKAENRAREIKALKALKGNLRQELEELENKLRPLLIEEYQEETGIKPGTLVVAEGFDHAGKVYRVNGFTVTTYGTVKPKAEMILKGGRVWAGTFTLYNKCSTLSEEDALKVLRATPEDE